MDRNSIILRPARPTSDEGLAYARYLDQAAEGFFRFMLGARSEEIIATAFARAGHDLSYQNVTFAEHENRIVGMISGYTGEQHRLSSRKTLKETTGKFHLRMRIISVLFAPVMRIIDSVPDDDFYLQAIAVDKELRSNGLGAFLMDATEEQARQKGSMRLSLDVSGRNEGACRFYERRGMKVTSRWPKRLPMPGMKFYRMTITL